MALGTRSRLRLAVGVFRETAGVVFSLPCLLPLLLYLAVRVALVAIHFAWYREPFAAIFYPMLVRSYGEAATHFPNDVPVIMALLTVANVAADLLVGPLALGAFVVAYAAAFLKSAGSTLESLKLGASRYLSLLALTALSLGVLLGGGAGYRWLAARLGPLWPLGDVETQESSFIFASLLVIPLVYAPVVLLLGKVSVPRAVIGGIRLFLKRPFETILLVLPLSLLFLPAGWVFERADAVVEAFSRSAVAVLALVEAALSAITLTLSSGYATRLFLYHRRLTP